MDSLKVERRFGSNCLVWADDDGSEVTANAGDHIYFIDGACEPLSGVLTRINSVCFYVELPRSDHDVPFPVKRITYISKE